MSCPECGEPVPDWAAGMSSSELEEFTEWYLAELAERLVGDGVPEPTQSAD